MTRDSLHTIGPLTRVSGSIQGAGTVRVCGVVHGSVQISGTLEIVEGARVDGPVSARLVTVAGTVEGDVVATEHARLEPSARVRGRVSSPRLVVEAGAHVVGALESGSPDAVSMGDVAIVETTREVSAALSTGNRNGHVGSRQDARRATAPLSASGARAVATLAPVAVSTERASLPPRDPTIRRTTQSAQVLSASASSARPAPRTTRTTGSPPLPRGAEPRGAASGVGTPSPTRLNHVASAWLGRGTSTRASGVGASLDGPNPPMSGRTGSPPLPPAARSTSLIHDDNSPDSNDPDSIDIDAADEVILITDTRDEAIVHVKREAPSEASSASITPPTGSTSGDASRRETSAESAVNAVDKNGTPEPSAVAALASAHSADSASEGKSGDADEDDSDSSAKPSRTRRRRKRR